MSLTAAMCGRNQVNRPKGTRIMLIKLALRRENDGTPIGHPAPTYFQCPCGTHIPVYDRQGNRIGGEKDGKLIVLKCAKCGQGVDIEGYLMASATRGIPQPDSD